MSLGSPSAFGLLSRSSPASSTKYHMSRWLPLCHVRVRWLVVYSLAYHMNCRRTLSISPLCLYNTPPHNCRLNPHLPAGGVPAQLLSAPLPSTMQRLVSRASCRGGLGATKTSVQGAAWRSLSIVDATGGSPTSMRVTDNRSSVLTGTSRRSVYTWRVPIPLTKIVATIGPASEKFEPLQKV